MRVSLILHCNVRTVRISPELIGVPLLDRCHVRRLFNALVCFWQMVTKIPFLPFVMQKYVILAITVSLNKDFDCSPFLGQLKDAKETTNKLRKDLTKIQKSHKQLVKYAKGWGKVIEAQGNSLVCIMSSLIFQSFIY